MPVYDLQYGDVEVIYIYIYIWCAIIVLQRGTGRPFFFNGKHIFM